jgi:GTP-binding protein
MNAFAVGGLDEYGKETLVVLDMPGYGKGAKAEWGKEIVKYLSKRKQLVRAFLLVDSEHGVKDTDRRILELFRENQVPFQIVLSKVDKIVGARRGGRGAKGQREDEDGGGEGNEQYAALLKRIHEVKDIIQPDMEEDGEVVGEIIACSSGEPKGKKLNIAALRFAVLKAAGLELQEKEIVDVSTGEEIVSFEEIARMSRSTKEGGSKDVDVG